MKRAFAAVCSLAAVGAWVLPGIAPEEYGHGQTVRPLRQPSECCRQSYSAQQAGEVSLAMRLVAAAVSGRHVNCSVKHLALPCAGGTPPQVDLKVNKLTSPKTHLGYENYKLKFCRVS